MVGRRLMKATVTALAVWLVATPSAVLAQEVITFWHSGTNVQTQTWLRENIFPEFERKHNVIVDDLAIGWGAQREEKLAVAFAAGVGPDIIVGSGNTPWAISLEEYVNQWEDRHQIPPAMWLNQRDVNGVVRGVPYVGAPRGFGYSRRVASEVGLPAESPPQSWEDLLEWARRLTQIDPNGAVVRSGFETEWNPPQVGSEFDWFLQQNGGSVASEDWRASTILGDAGLEALEIMKELYQLGRGPGVTQPVSQGAFPQGRVGIARVVVQTFAAWKELNGDIEDLAVYSPRRSPAHAPVTLTFVDGFVITEQSRNPDLAWELIKVLLSPEVQHAYAKYNNYGPVRQDVALSGEPHVEQFAPLYRIAEFSRPPGFFPGRSQAAPILVQALRGEVAPMNALLQMHEAQQREIDRFWEEQ